MDGLKLVVDEGHPNQWRIIRLGVEILFEASNGLMHFVYGRRHKCGVLQQALLAALSSFGCGETPWRFMLAAHAFHKPPMQLAEKTQAEREALADVPAHIPAPGHSWIPRAHPFCRLRLPEARQRLLNDLVG
ncbi:MAG: hypothetical protein M5R40_14270 [Anaerolineae bacterium]|nr:hypothetical protein [Anaerolineae bacterium]